MNNLSAFSLDFSNCSNGYVGRSVGTLYKWLRGYDLAPVEDTTGNGRGWVLFFKATPRRRRLRTYAEMQDAARNLAIDWQDAATEWRMSYAECAAWGDLFTDLGRRYGLMREFHENGIC